MTLLNSNFEDWRLANPDAPLDKFPFNTKKMGVSGALFDIEKLGDVSKNVISRMSAAEVADRLTAWAREYDPGFCALLERDPAYTEAILSIGRGGKKPRKDIARVERRQGVSELLLRRAFRLRRRLPRKRLRRRREAHPRRIRRNLRPRGRQRRLVRQDQGARPSGSGYAANMKDYKQNPSAYPAASRM